MKERNRVLIAGIGGASLGTEIAKCLAVTQCYIIYGCDISPLAFGHYQKDFEDTFIVSPINYIDSVIQVCRKNDINYIIPGGEQPLSLLSEAITFLQKNEIQLVSNDLSLVTRLADKHNCFEFLGDKGIQIPLTLYPNSPDDFIKIGYPCIVKPSTGSGGSDFVFIAGEPEEAKLYVDYLLRNQRKPLLQEYITLDEGEFSFGVLSLPNVGLVGSIALKRCFPSKISIHAKSNLGIISSPYSQGLIDEFKELRVQAEYIAAAIGSSGPLNIQGRIKNGVLIPFEINPRFSGSDYVRTMAGLNQPHIFLHYMITDEVLKPQKYNYGYYFRSLTEVYTGKTALKQ